MGKAIVSLERAYHLFLSHGGCTENTRESDKLTKSEYLVYSHFMRFGCNLRRFKNDDTAASHTDSSFAGDNDADASVSSSLVYKSYVWNYLNELLGHRKSVIAIKNVDHSCYNRIKDSMNGIIAGFKNANSCRPDSLAGSSVNASQTAWKVEKRKIAEDSGGGEMPKPKMPKLCHNKDLNAPYLGGGSTNDFMLDNAFHRFKQIFDKINIIELKTMDFSDDHKPINEKFSFDLWTSMDYRERQRVGPNFRLVVR